MKLALLGSNCEALALVRAIATSNQDEIVAAYDVELHVDELEELIPDAIYDDHWESLLLGTVADAVIIAGKENNDARADQLRKLVQAAIPMLVIQPICPAIVGYELDMIRRDTNCVMVPFSAGYWHPAIRTAKEAVERGGESEIGEVEQIVIERVAVDRSRENVLRHLVRDGGLIRHLIGDTNKISAFGSAGENQYSNLSVSMTSQAGTLSRWSIGPVSDSARAKLKLIGSRGSLTIDMTPSERDWTLSNPAHTANDESFEDWDVYKHALLKLANAIDGESSTPDWADSCRDLEISDTAQRSLRRGRAIELYEEQHTEEQTFKGIMAVGGCSILLAGLLLLFGLALFDGLMIPFRDDEEDGERSPRAHLLIRLWPFYPFVLFLLLQLLRLVFRGERKESEPNVA